jgi:HSP20 family protein
MTNCRLQAMDSSFMSQGSGPVGLGARGVSGRAKSKRRSKTSIAASGEYGSFVRTVPLPEGVKLEDIKSTFADGGLEVSVPLPPQPTLAARTVEIEEGGKPSKAA